MTKITLYPTVPLTPFAERHYKEFTFGTNAPLAPLTETFEKRDLNWFGRCVKKLIDCDSPIVEKIGSIVIRLLNFLVIGRPLYREVRAQISERFDQNFILDKLNTQNVRINKRAEIVELVGLEEFKNLPHSGNNHKQLTRVLEGRSNKEGISTSTIKGQDWVTDAFISFKLQNKASSQIFWFTIYEFGGITASYWSYYVEPGTSHPPITKEINARDLALLRDIIQGKNPDFTLCAG